MAMKIPSAGNPFAVDVRVNSPEGLMTPKASGYASSQLTKMEKMQAQWQENVDNTHATDIINKLDKVADDVANNEQYGYKNQMGKNAIERESNKSLWDESSERFKQAYDQAVGGFINPNVRRKVDAYYRARSEKMRNDVNAHVIKQQQLYEASVNAETLETAQRLIMSDNPEDAASGVTVMKELTDGIANKSGLRPDYSKTLGEAVSLRVLQDLDNNDPKTARQWLDGAKDYMSTAQYYKANHAIKQAEKRIARQAKGESVRAKYEQIYSEESMASQAYEHATGKKMPEGLFETCLDIADGDHVKALEIAVVGVDEWTEENRRVTDDRGNDITEVRSPSNMALVGRAGRKYIELSKQANKSSVLDIANRLMELDKDLDVEEASRQAKKILRRRADVIDARHAREDMASNSVYAELLSGKSVDDLPPSYAEGIPAKTLQGLTKFSDRRQDKSLANNYALRERFYEAPELLKNMTDSQFLAHAGDFTVETFNELAAFRAGLRSNSIQPVKKSVVREQVRQAFIAHDVKKTAGSGNAKALQGLVVKMLEDALVMKINGENKGEPMTDEQVSTFVGNFLANNFEPETWGWNSTESVKKIAEGNAAEFGSTLEKILDAGLREGAQILAPTNVNRTEQMLRLLYFPEMSVSGAKAMVEEIKTWYPDLRNEDASDPTRFVRAFLRQHPELIIVK